VGYDRPESVCSLLCMGGLPLSLRFEGAVAEVWAGFALNGRGGRKGIATENLEARKRVRYKRPAHETVMMSLA
jgi:hypothetical protein